MLNVISAGYVKILFSKCDESKPFVGYTLDYEDFIKEDFAIEQNLGDDLISDLVLKIK